MNKGWGIIALVVAGLYWLQAVLIPLALAVLLTFLLSPVVGSLQRRGLGRVPSVLVTVLLALSILGGIGWTLTRQLVTLADELPRYSLNIHRRIADLRGASKGGSVEKVQKAVEDVVGEIQKTDTPGATRQKPVAVVLEPPSILVHLPNLLQALASAGLVTVLMIFMLLERRELRDRVILLIGYRRMTATTRALDEAGARISRYLLMQSIINGSFGLAVGLGLFLIGVPYAVTWGPWRPPFGSSRTWGHSSRRSCRLPSVWRCSRGGSSRRWLSGLFLVLELITGSVMEPWLYGQSAGVSHVALLIAVTFWAWLWGPVGLLMATPLTVCLIVLGKHLPALGFLVVLMGDRPVTEAKARYYQRLLARDLDEATDIVEAYVNTDGRESVYDTVLLPALYYAKQDRDRGLLSEGDAQFVGQATREILDAARPRRARLRRAGPRGSPRHRHPGPDRRVSRSRRGGCLGARDGATPARPGAAPDGREQDRDAYGRGARLGRPAPPRACLHRDGGPWRLEPGATSLQAPALATSGAQDRGGSLGSPRRNGCRSPAAARGRSRSRRNDGARYTTDAGDGGAYARPRRSGIATDAGSRRRAMDRPDDSRRARAFSRRVTGILNRVDQDQGPRRNSFLAWAPSLPGTLVH